MEDNKMKYDFGKEVAGLFPLYDKVKRIIILAERLDCNGRISLGAVNEMRNVADHIFKASQETTQGGGGREIKKIKEHLERAGYDACEIIANETIFYIGELLAPYGNDCLVAVFPEYYRKIRPEITKIQVELTDIRAAKKEAFGDFEKYYRVIQVLAGYREMIESAINGLEEFADKARKKKKQELLWTIGITFLSTVAAGLLLYFLTR
ncbi:hypothetical protein FACS1894181_03100 [Bacteroidia bacterium]|nr:hypothetical protein FACS1894181_03100 [Bacteroidia bacterium]